MKIAFYMPFKPMGHQNPSGDLIIGTELHDFLQAKGAEISLASRFRCRWIYLKPYLWPFLLFEIVRVVFWCKKEKPDIWLTYHSYYKAPDLLGSLCCRILDIPYVIFQGIYSTKRRKVLKTKPGFYLNRMALNQTTCTVTNKTTDRENLARLLPANRTFHIPPGIHPEQFQYDQKSRKKIRKELQIEDKTVIMTAAMFRPGVKTDGLLRVLESCETLMEQGLQICLLIAGDGVNRSLLQKRADEKMGERVIFLGKLPRKALHAYYSAADIFVFPGIEESLGMVYLEAQASRLPVVAYSDWGAKEAVRHGLTGLLSPASDLVAFTNNLKRLTEDSSLRKKMGGAAVDHVNTHHSIQANYSKLWRKLEQIVEEYKKR